MENQISQKNESVQNHPALSILMVIVFGVLAISPTYFWGMPVGADFDNHFRFALPFYNEIADGNYAPGWLAESNNDFGDARFRFYPPNLYYLLCLFRYFTGDWYWATLIIFTVFSVVGALGVYFWTRRTLSDKTAVIAALLFSFILNHLTQFYQASLLAEFAATALLPFAFMFVERLTTGKNYGTKHLSAMLFNVAGLAAIYSLIIITHLPTTILASYSLGLYALLLTDWKTNKKALAFCALGIAIGLLSSSWFWVKMVSELGWIQGGDAVSSPYYDYQNNFIFSPFSLVNLNSWYGSLIAVLTLAIFLPSLIILRQIFKKSSSDENHSGNNLIAKFSIQTENEAVIKKRLRACLIIAFVSLLMMTDLSRPLWATVPKLKDVQFPYRWLAITSVLVCPIVALSLRFWWTRIKQKRIRPIHLPLLLAFAFAFLYTAQGLVFDSEYISRDRFLQRIEEVRGGRSFNNWLPRGANELKDLSPLDGKVNAGGRKISVINWQSHRRIFSVDAGAETTARVRSYYYPLWQASVLKDGQKTPTPVSQAADGTLLVALPPDAVTIEIVFNEPLRTKISFAIAALGWLLTFALLITSFYKKPAEV